LIEVSAEQWQLTLDGDIVAIEVTGGTAYVSTSLVTTAGQGAGGWVYVIQLYGPMTALPRARSMDLAAPDGLTEVQEISSCDACRNRTLICCGWPGVTVTGPSS